MLALLITFPSTTWRLGSFHEPEATGSVMGTSKAIRLGSSICLLALAACGGGGNAAPVVPTVSIAAPATTNVAGFSGANVGTNFTNNLPPVGTTISLAGATVSASSTSVADANIRRITATYRGTVTSGGLAYPVFDLSVPELSLTASQRTRRRHAPDTGEWRTDQHRDCGHDIYPYERLELRAARRRDGVSRSNGHRLLHAVRRSTGIRYRRL